MTPWHALPPEEALSRLGSDAKAGLGQAEAARRLERFGRNVLEEKAGRGAAALLYDQLKSTMVVMLVAAGGISLALGERVDACAIGAILLINVGLGFYQEYSANRSMEALRRLAVSRCRALRGGKLVELETSGLVPGDVVALEAGASVPADARLVEAAALSVDESSLTGESLPSEKDAAAVPADAELADRSGMVYLGTRAVSGRGLALVVETGMRTELGRVASSIREAEDGPTPLQRRLEKLGRQLAVAALGVVGVFAASGALRGEPAGLILLTAVSMAVAAVPEGLPAVVTATLAIAARRMLARKALVRKLTAVEALGSVTVICSDKTGTLTENRMTVGAVEAPGVDLALAAAALCGDARFAGEGAGRRAVGDPTETAFLVAAAERGLDKAALERALPRAAEVPFDSVRKRMTTVHAVREDALGGLPESVRAALAPALRAPAVAFVKGSAESVVRSCETFWDGARAVPLDEAERARLAGREEALAARGMRVLAAALRPLDRVENAGAESGLMLAGLLGLVDPPREEARAAVAACARAGIRLAMITGDHPATARAIADALGLPPGGTLTGRELSALSPEELARLAETTTVYARVSPEHKLRIVAALQARGNIVAMTGDGVNDAPALKKADIGVAMGRGGTDVAKEASEMVLLDDSLATIVAAVGEGRVIYDNVRKFLKFLMTTNVAELGLMLAAPLVGVPLPLTPVQILWINLMTDGAPALALAFEPAEPDVMTRGPRSPSEPLFDRRIVLHVVWCGALMTALALAIARDAWAAGGAHWRSVALMAVVAMQLAHALAIRSDQPIFGRLSGSNGKLAAAVVATLLLQLCALYVPALGSFIGASPLTGRELGQAAGAAAAIFLAVELEKLARRRGGGPSSPASPGERSRTSRRPSRRRRLGAFLRRRRRPARPGSSAASET